MTKLLVLSDLHVDAGANLGDGNSRLADAEEILTGIMTGPDADADALVFCGDLTQTSAPDPLMRAAAYRVVQRAFQQFDGPVYLMTGNHDGTVADKALSVIGASLPDARVIDIATFIDRDDCRLCFLPWTPTASLFDSDQGVQASNVMIADRLHNIARGLVDHEKPSVLFLHWMLAGQKLASGKDVLIVHEPLLYTEEIEAAGYKLAIAGHNHVPGQLSPACWSCGATMRGGFGEADVPVGYMTVTVNGDVKPAYHPVKDRSLITLTLDAAAMTGEIPSRAELAGAVVRIRYECQEHEAKVMAQHAAEIKQRVLDHGASKVLGPFPTVHRVRRERDRISIDLEPVAALRQYLDMHNITGELRHAVEREALAIIGEADVPIDEQLAFVEPDPW